MPALVVLMVLAAPEWCGSIWRHWWWRAWCVRGELAGLLSLLHLALLVLSVWRVLLVMCVSRL